MFTGIIEKLGQLETLAETRKDLWEITIGYDGGWNDLEIGESIAVNGACLTLTSFDAQSLSMQLSPETMLKTLFGAIQPNAGLNLERAMKLGGRLGGHLLQGHVEGFAEVLAVNDQKDCREITFGFSREHRPYMIEKGSVGLNGVSLTICDLANDSFKVALIPATLSATNLKSLSCGDKVHLETDMIAKYIESITKQSPQNN